MLEKSFGLHYYLKQAKNQKDEKRFGYADIKQVAAPANGYTHRMAVLIGETTVTFEPDEAGDYRALT